ncbi:hypothetical protein QQZ08_005918 [Neonectria magnoliae]|uniref:Uncharacterized protein n=1 Tax=Neonectria magnoliae TaxID=2732573 RepID=A0ABR1I2A1_9HYPO
MKPKLSAWFQGKVDKYIKKKDTPFPRLPDPRPQALTPSPSQEVLPQECLFFARLPYELRRGILIHAFGKDRLHMDLSFEHPPAPYAPGEPRERDHAGVHATNGGCGKYAKLDRKKPKSWLWWGSICHRYYRPPDQRSNPGPMSGGWGPTGPWDDYCRHGYAADCDKWPGDVPFKC